MVNRNLGKVLEFYIDDSGTRNPNHDPGNKPSHGHDYFALGGILIRGEDESIARELHSKFCANWEIDPKVTPLHSSEIRGKSGGFAWVGRLDSDEQEKFYEELYQLLRDVPVLGLACVIDRPGYNHRYLEKYGQNRWLLCKTAFTIVVERAAKYARSLSIQTRIWPEKCNRAEDHRLGNYYRYMKSGGMPFDTGTSSSYGPLRADEFQGLLCGFRTKAKTSPMAQLADLYLWPMAMGGYDKGNRPYRRLLEDGKLIDCILGEEEIPDHGIKYSCFDLVEPRP